MEELSAAINKVDTEIDAIEQILEKDYEEWTTNEQNHVQLRVIEQELLKQKSISLKRDHNPPAPQGIEAAGNAMDIDIDPARYRSRNNHFGDATLPKLGDANSMYDVFDRLSSKSTSTPLNYRSSVISAGKRCNFGSLKFAVEAFFQGVTESAPIGSTEATIDSYVGLMIESVADALRLNVRLERQSFINSKKAENWVIAFGENEKQGGRIVGCNENKLPHTKYQEPFVTNHNEFLVQIHDQMNEVFNYYGPIPVFGIGSTGREWRFFKLPHDDSCKLGDASFLSREKAESKQQNDSSPLTGNMPPIQHGSDVGMEIEQEDGEIQEEKRKLIGTKIYKWNDQEMLFMLGSVLKQMSLSKMAQISLVTKDSIQDRAMWHLIKTEARSPWGWAKLSVSKLHWKTMISTGTNNVVVLGMLGKGSDGKVLLVPNKKGQVSAMKLLESEENAENEAKHWTEIYKAYCHEYKWTIRSEKWMGIPAVIMPVLNQFMTKKERFDNLNGVKECLELIHERGYRHEDVHWRNIGYFKTKDKIIVLMLDLHPGHVMIDNDKSRSWIDVALAKLKKRAIEYFAIILIF